MERIEPKYILSEEEYNELAKWKEFAQKVWEEVGPYGNFREGSNLSNELRYKMQDLFNFDDSE
jgi:hypothetical protein